MSLTPYSDLLLRISRDDSFIQVLRFLIMSAQNQAQVQKQVTTQAIAPTNNNPQPSTNAAFVNDPTFWIIIALAFLFRVILSDRPSSGKK
jgi:hypothetical protein